MNGIKLHDVLIVGEDELEVEVVAIDDRHGLITTYDAVDDQLAVFVVSGDRMNQIQFIPKKEPWEA